MADFRCCDVLLGGCFLNLFVVAATDRRRVVVVVAVVAGANDVVDRRMRHEYCLSSMSHSPWQEERLSSVELTTTIAYLLVDLIEFLFIDEERRVLARREKQVKQRNGRNA